MQFRKLLLGLPLLMVLFAGCSEYSRILKSQDVDEKYEYAKRYYEKGLYTRSVTLLSDVVPIYRGTEKAEEALYLLAMSHFKLTDYVNSSEYFQRYCNNFPRGSRIQECRFNLAYGDYKDSPDARLDQTVTKKAIKELDDFIDMYPRTQLADSATAMRIELSDKLCYKEYLSAKLYLNLGTYMGNNYEAAVIVARNAQNEYPYSKYREDLAFIIFKARYEAAVKSVAEKAEERYRAAYDEYFTFNNEYPETVYAKETQKMYEKLKKKMAEYGE
ncbi:MAG: outer membrane protein assembly factor BamD [Bacteroidales bacterium]|nr:outer membrane protein assembly factor BamD [Bacteroidales bacterium]MBP5680124.1 outer membrane protein assembly factor BamD [Bacteroidales bacterium]